MRRKAVRDLIVETVVDYGPSVSRDREGHLVSTGPAQVLLEDRDDISVVLNSKARRPVVRGARRWDALRAMLKWIDGVPHDDAITVRQYDAATRFLDDCSRAQGSSAASFTQIVVSGGSGRDAFTEKQREAIQRVMRVRILLGLNPDCVFWWVVLNNQTARDYAIWRKMRYTTAYDWLRAALTALDKHYNPPASGSRNREV